LLVNFPVNLFFKSSALDAVIKNMDKNIKKTLFITFFNKKNYNCKFKNDLK
jgi:hypothetical protein